MSAPVQPAARTYRVWAGLIFIAGVVLLRTGFLRQRANLAGRYKFTDQSVFGWQAMAVGLVLIIAAVYVWRAPRR